MRLHDTATREQREFVPVRPGTASIYVCGATVQGAPHIGHVRSGLNYDVLRRWLTHGGLDVLLVRNVTDIEDKVLAKSAAAHRPWWEWAATYERAFQAAYAALGCLPAEHRAARQRARAADDRAHGAAHRLRARLRRGRRRLLRRALLSRLRRPVRPEDRRRRAGRAGFRHQARPARLRALEGGQARRAVVGHPVGPRAPGLAPGVLGDGHHVPRPRVRRPRRRHRPDLPAPRERAGPVARGGRRLRALLAAQRVGHDGGREDVQVAGQHALDRRAAAPRARGRAALLPGGAALPVVDRVLRRGAVGGRRGLPADRVVRAPGARAGRRPRAGHPVRGVRGVDGRRPGHPRRAGRRPHHRARGQHRARRGQPRGRARGGVVGAGDDGGARARPVRPAVGPRRSQRGGVHSAVHTGGRPTRAAAGCPRPPRFRGRRRGARAARRRRDRRRRQPRRPHVVTEGTA